MKKTSEQKRTGLSYEQAKVIPIAREEVRVDKRRKETGLTRIRKIVHETTQRIQEPVTRETVEVERVPVNKVVEKTMPVRDEDGTMIVPVYEEIAVVEKRLLLKEELHIRKRTEKSFKAEEIVVRSEEAVVEHIDMPEHAAAEKEEGQEMPEPPVRRAGLGGR